MDESVLVASAHSDIIYYLRVQGLISLLAAAAVAGPYIALSILSPAIWRKRKFLLSAPFSLVIGLLFGYLAVRSFAMSTPTLTLSGDTLRVGDETLALTAPVELVFSDGTPEVPDGPFGDNVFNHLPGGASFPPSFDGGPFLTVKSGAGSIEFRPYVYGPFRIFGEAASRDAAKLMRALTARSTAGEGREWLEKMFVVEFQGDGRPRKDFGSFLLWAGVVVVVIAGLMAVVVVNSRRKQERRRQRSVRADV